MPSFDAVSELDVHELTNAVDQANRELTQRFDFKDTGAVFELDEKTTTVSMKAPSEFQLKQMLDILTQRLGKRGIDSRCMEKKDPVSIPRKVLRGGRPFSVLPNVVKGLARDIRDGKVDCRPIWRHKW